MSESSINIMSSVQKIEIRTTLISTTKDKLNSFILMPFKLHLHPIGERKRFSIQNIEFRLMAEEGTLLSQHLLTTTISVSRNETFDDLVRLKLSDLSVEIIEKLRKGDAKFTLEVEFQIMIFSENGLDSKLITFDRIEKQCAFINLSIPKSEWVEKLLNGLNYKAFRLIQVPVISENGQESFDHVFTEFNIAQDYFVKHDYYNTVAHCRNVIDSLNRNLQTAKKSGITDSKFEWIKTLTTANKSFIEELTKANHRLASKAHHPGSFNDFNRTEAESVYLVTLSLVHFISGAIVGNR